MPIYEYTCNDCTRLTSVFVRRVDSQVAPKCQHCGGERMQRAISRVAVHKTEQQILEEYGTPQPGGGPDSYKDPRQIGRWVEQRFEQMGMDLPQEARTMIDAAREGEFPAPVKDL